MRYSHFVPVGVAALFAACTDSSTGPDTADFLRQVNGGRLSIAATQTAGGLWERRIEYDWTAQRYVTEIHVGEDMRLLPDRHRVEILPGQTAWVSWKVSTQRRLASDEIVEGVRGETCVTNTGTGSIPGFVVVEQVMVKNGGSFVPLAGVSVVVRSEESLEATATRCVPYEVLFDAEADVEYTVVASIGALSGLRVAEASADFALPHEQDSLEVDADAWVRDGAYAGCDETLGPDFICMSADALPRDQWMFPPTATAQPGMTFMVDITNPGVCGETFVYTIDEPLREGGPTPPGGEVREVSGSLIITTGECPPPGGGVCVRTEEWWRTHYGAGTDPDSVTQYLTILLGSPHGAKTLPVPPSHDVIRYIFARAGVTNPIGELYAQLFIAKLNMARGSDPVVLREVRVGADVFLATHTAADWETLSESQQRAVEEWVAVLTAYNTGKLGPGVCGAPPPPPPEPGQACTRTIGYWRNHAGFGPQADVVTPLLPLWVGMAGGAKSVHVTTAALAVSLLDRRGDASNGINKLYAQLLGAKLNIANGASSSGVFQTIAQADLFLASHGTVDWYALSSSQRQQVLAWMSTLDDYNNGRLGPGHCD
jgi:hypothetical protein